ncbi:replicative DNA helicase [Stutzerimonas stutzeri]|uniref:hypothetical protein n=1 Tax=Stutzerimonas stutzeri subgroup TaxID=578833 RepID=UPI000C6E5514|nr:MULTISPECIES: hypothetical protein [Stutzerimonas stutzeri subgroup]MCQ2049380.1 hypothetical protein [Stutzerimonas kunmingensis]PKR26561.1 hypothetical protein CXK90_13035 [Stutzerimonas stutzeri]QQC09365.1 hypothetical protein I6I22_10750 [Stutzerimonas stutzeri]VEI35308.1 replicative DNA helicase [Stutzerimonas stutzeri]
MNHPQITATAVEKLKRAAKSLRNASDCNLATALDHVAAQAGYSNWKRVTELAAKPSLPDRQLLPAKHRNRLTWVHTRDQKLIKVHTVSELCEALGSATPFFIRQPCESSTPENPCLCQLDPFATAMQAGVALDIGDKHDFWNYLFDLNQPAREFPAWEKRVVVGLATWDHYPNEHLTTQSNDDLSNTLNPNNSANKATANNRATQLNPNT